MRFWRSCAYGIPCLFLRRIDGNAPHTPFQIPCLFAEQTFSPIQLVPFHRHQLFILQRLPQRRNALPQHTAAELIARGKAETLCENAVILLDPDCYNSETGFTLSETTKANFI